MACLAPRDLLRRSLRHELASLIPCARAEIDDPVGGLDHVQVVFHHQNGMSRVDQALEHLQQHPHVFEMQARRGLIEQEQRWTAVSPRVPFLRRRTRAHRPGQVPHQLQPLALAAG